MLHPARTLLEKLLRVNNFVLDAARRSDHALYAGTLASYAEGETFPHEAAEGFIRLASLETELLAARHRSPVA